MLFRHLQVRNLFRRTWYKVGNISNKQLEWMLFNFLSLSLSQTPSCLLKIKSLVGIFTYVYVACIQNVELSPREPITFETINRESQVYYLHVRS